MIWSKSRRQTKTSLVCVFSEVQRTDKEQIFHASHHAYTHSTDSNRADFFFFSFHCFSLLYERQWGQDIYELRYSQGEKNIFRKTSVHPQPFCNKNAILSILNKFCFPIPFHSLIECNWMSCFSVSLALNFTFLVSSLICSSTQMEVLLHHCKWYKWCVRVIQVYAKNNLLVQHLFIHHQLCLTTSYTSMMYQYKR